MDEQVRLASRRDHRAPDAGGTPIYDALVAERGDPLAYAADIEQLRESVAERAALTAEAAADVRQEVAESGC